MHPHKASKRMLRHCTCDIFLVLGYVLPIFSYFPTLHRIGVAISSGPGDHFKLSFSR